MFFVVLLAIFVLPLILLKIYAVVTCARCTSKVCLQGKTALITGGNSGIGFQMVLALASRGCRIIIADKVKSPNLEKSILEETHNSDVEYKYLDLASFSSVRQFAIDLAKSGKKIDILINNAGIGTTTAFKTEDGLDGVMQINYFAPFLLTHLLVGMLSSSARVIFTSSGLAYVNSLTIEKLRPGGITGKYDLYYPDSKFCLIVAADQFAQKLRSRNITFNTFHPGIVYTNIFNESKKRGSSVDLLLFGTNFFHLLSFLVGKTPEEGAQTAIHLACANEVEGVTGQFFGEMQSVTKPKAAYNSSFCKQIWTESEKIVGLKQSEKLK